MGIIRFYDDSTTSTWEDFCNRITSENLIDPVSGDTVVYTDSKIPIRRSADNSLVFSWEDVAIKFKVYGTSAYGDLNPRWHETTLTWSRIQQYIDMYNDEHGTNHQLDLSVSPCLWIKPRDTYSNFYVAYNDSDKVVTHSAITSSGSIIDGTINEGFKWLNGTPDYPVNVPFNGDLYDKGWLVFIGNKCYIQGAQPHDNIGNFNESYLDINIPILYTASDSALYRTANPKRIEEIPDSLTERIVNFFGSGTKEEKDISPKVYYYNMALYDKDEQVHYRSWHITTYSKVNAYQTDGIPYNIEFNVSGINQATYSAKGSKIVIQEDGQTRIYEDVDAELLESLTRGLYSFIEYEVETNQIIEGSHVWSTNVVTNLTLWDTMEESNANLNNNLDDSMSKNGGKTLSTIKIRTGQDLEKTDVNEWGNKSFVRTFVISESELEEIGDALWSNEDTDVMDAILKGSKIVQNPIEMIVGSYYFPFNIRPFCDTTARKIRLGGYDTGIIAPSVVGHHIDEIASSFIKPVFNNALDYSNVSVTLFLPFYGLAPIDYATIINTQLSIRVSLDPTNATLKYYIMSDGKIISTFGTNVGASIPVTGNDVAGKQRENIQASMNIVSSSVGVASDVTSIAGGVATGNPGAIAGGVGGLINNGMSIANSVLDINSAPRQLYSGACSSGVSSADPLYCYIIFDVQESIIPSNLYSEYGYPSNIIKTIGSSSGWTECMDVKLVGNMLDTEKSEILQLLAQGVII